MKPTLACTNCRIRKKKCDRAYPICSYCFRTHGRCSYRVSGNSNHSTGSIVISPPLTSPRDIPWKSTLTAAMFLDYPLFREIHSQANVGGLVIGPEIRDYITSSSGLDDSVTKYLEVVDCWISFIPRRELRTRLSGPTQQLNEEEMLILACIKIVTNNVTEANPRTKAYLAIKSTFVNAEVSGTVSVPLLQAMLLLVLYEFGHGIYPCAYTTLGTCVQYLAALGIDGAGPPWNKSDRWIDIEIRRRLWWGVFVMERVIGLGCPQRPLLMKEPDGNKILPSDELSWEQEYPSTQYHLTLQSPASSNMGSFRLLVLTSHLLGRVIDHLSDDQLDAKFVSERTLQLYRTVRALMAVADVEEAGIISVGMSRSLLHSAILLLYPISDHLDDESAMDLQQPCALSASLYLERGRIFLRGDLGSVDKASPFLLHWGFKTFQYYYAKYRQEGHYETQKALKDLEQVFFALEKRWKLAGVYATLLNVCQGG